MVLIVYVMCAVLFAGNQSVGWMVDLRVLNFFLCVLWLLFVFVVVAGVLLSTACVVPPNEKDFNVDNVRVSKILVSLVDSVLFSTFLFPNFVRCIFIIIYFLKIFFSRGQAFWDRLQ